MVGGSSVGGVGSMATTACAGGPFFPYVVTPNATDTFGGAGAVLVGGGAGKFVAPRPAVTLRVHLRGRSRHFEEGRKRRALATARGRRQGRTNGKGRKGQQRAHVARRTRRTHRANL